MSVAVFLPAPQLSHVRHVLAHEPELLVAESWEELEAFIHRKPVTAVILDPLADGIMNVAVVASLLTRFPSLPLIAYVSLGASAFNAVAQLSRLGLEDVLLHRFDDAPERFKERVERVQGNPLSRKIIDSLAPLLARLPLQVASAIENMFEQPHRYGSAGDLAMGAKIPIVRLYRNLNVAHLGSPKKLLVAAKLLRGYSYLRDPGYTVVDVSVKLGYRTTRVFNHHSVSVFGLTPLKVRVRVAEADAVRSILDWLKEPMSNGKSARAYSH